MGVIRGEGSWVLPSSAPFINTNTKKKRKKRNFVSFAQLGIQQVATDVLHNKVLIAASVSAAIGQLAKPFTASLLYGRPATIAFNFTSAFQSGGFPSTHSSAVVAAATSLGLERGFSDSIFGLTVVYASLVMYDAQGVRREVGNHARVINRKIIDITDDGLIDSSNASTANDNDKEALTLSSSNYSPPLLLRRSRLKASPALKESIGHTEIEVIAGALLGFFVSLAVNAVM